MIDRELEAAFDDLFVGDDPPRTNEEAIARLSSALRCRLESDAESRRMLAELVWMSSILRSSAPRPSISFADRVAQTAFASALPQRKQNWRFAVIGSVVAATILFAVAMSLRRPNGPGASDFVRDDRPSPVVEPPTIALLDQMRKIVPRMPSESPLASVELASLIGKAETGSLTQTFAAPATGLSTVGKALEKEVKPIGNSMRDAFAFLGEFPAREKRSL
jgi:hypothetical protein